MQKNWIGMSEGAEIKFKISQSKLSIDIFTTRPETIFGASFIALSVEHTLSSKFLDNEKFIEFFKKGLVYKKDSFVNWDPVDKTVLANEQVIDGKGWRSGAVVEKKKLSQWFLNISKFSKELLGDLN